MLPASHASLECARPACMTRADCWNQFSLTSHRHTPSQTKRMATPTMAARRPACRNLQVDNPRPQVAPPLQLLVSTNGRVCPVCCSYGKSPSPEWKRRLFPPLKNTLLAFTKAPVRRAFCTRLSSGRAMLPKHLACTWQACSIARGYHFYSQALAA